MSRDARVIIRLILGYVLMAAFLFIPAGSIYWIEAWIYIILQFSFSIATFLWLRKNNPELLRERMGLVKREVKSWDKVLMISTTPFFFALIVIPGLDAVRFHWSFISGEVKMLGTIGIFFSLTLFFVVIRENTFLSNVVRIQEERGHCVITTGPYRFVRHPMYVAVITLFFAIPVALGSLYGIIPAGFLAVGIIIRTSLEDKILQRELSGYKEYTQETKYRLLPGVW